MVQPDAFKSFVPPPRSLAFDRSNNRSVVVLGVHMRKCAGTAVRRIFADTGAWGAAPYCSSGIGSAWWDREWRRAMGAYGSRPQVGIRQQWGPDADRLLFWELKRAQIVAPASGRLATYGSRCPRDCARRALWTAELS